MRVPSGAQLDEANSLDQIEGNAATGVAATDPDAGDLDAAIPGLRVEVGSVT